jgi:hypothetical protein
MREPRLPSQGEKLRGPYLLTPTETMAGRKVRAEHTSSHFVVPRRVRSAGRVEMGVRIETRRLPRYRGEEVRSHPPVLAKR